jgi:hypothetical protein
MDQYYGSLEACEFEYAPGNAPTPYCIGIGVGANPAFSSVSLQPCGVSPLTVWVASPTLGNRFVLINLGSPNGASPDVLTNLLPQFPGFWLVTLPLTPTFTQGSQPIQAWFARFGSTSP